ncbi:MAG: ABC-type transport auxiliary lipoprotein component [Verrucomicrobiota bacterium]|jgi:uncharacterized lipoprotein YmbA
MKIQLLLPALLLSLCSCGVLQPVKDGEVYHVLTALVPNQTLSRQSPAIAIKRPTLPGYLNRQQPVTRSGGQLVVSRNDVWAEPLNLSISRVTASNLSRLTGSLNIRPVENFTTLDYTSLLEINITRFEPDDSNRMILEGTWKLQPVSGSETHTRFFHHEAPLPSTSSSMGDRVAAMNQTLADLARQINREL